ncbi:ScbA/BarX family gamma-butyrolactone biosynthesis protein [Streptomyces sp. NPDC058459]|uniref:ScbA/BarX family gamma-butyrolactone biosynthesis protein n=1 Tax=Streptomyces sp. NPDC058459 TaxID=3346508 RepID=UPI00365B0DCA
MSEGISFIADRIVAGISPAGRTVMTQAPDPAAPPEDQTGSLVLVPDSEDAGQPPSRGGRATAELVHRPDAADAFPVEWTRLAEHRYRVAVDWPAGHRFFAPLPGGYQDPLLIAETTRQTAMMMAHAEYGVPADHHFVMRDMQYALATADFGLTDASGRIDVVIHCAEAEPRSGSLARMRVRLRFERDGRLLATSVGSLRCTSDRAYRRMRGDRPAAVGDPVPLLEAVPPGRVGRLDPRDVVLAPPERGTGWRLRLDTTHPTLFARANDHVPGMVLLEAARQAAVALAPEGRFLPASMAITFHRYAELTEPCLVRAWSETSPEGDVSVHVEGVQGGEAVFTATLGDNPETAR